MSPDDPRHGTYAGAVAHSKAHDPICDPCSLASRRAHKRRRLNIARGVPPTVPLGEDAWNIVSTFPRAVITAQTGITAGKLQTYANAGPERIVRRGIRDRILAVRGWTTVGITRRLQALSCIGWSMQALDPEIGVSKDRLKLIRMGDRHFVRMEVAAKIADGYERLCMETPTGRGASRARNDAARNGWLPPLAWTVIDDPDESPTGWQYTPATRHELLTDLTAQGFGLTETCRHLGISADALQKWCARNNLSDVYRSLAAGEALESNQHTGRGAA